MIFFNLLLLFFNKALLYSSIHGCYSFMILYTLMKCYDQIRNSLIIRFLYDYSIMLNLLLYSQTFINRSCSFESQSIKRQNTNFYCTFLSSFIINNISNRAYNYHDEPTSIIIDDSVLRAKNFLFLPVLSIINIFIGDS